MMAPLSIEEDNYIRLALLLKGVSPRAVRTYFDTEFPPDNLPSRLNTNYNTLNDLKLSRVLNQAQWNLLFPRNGVPDSITFDVALMICLIRHLTMVDHPINGFDRLPPPRETTPGPDLARIKWYRNKLDHHDSNRIDTVYFNTAWPIISDAVSRLGGQQMNQECQELKVKILDQSNKEIMLETKQSQEKIQELRQTVDRLGTEHSEVTENLSKLQTDNSKITENMKELQDSYSSLQTEHLKVTEILSEPIPRNIRGQIKEELESWENKDKMFIETNGAKKVLEYIKENCCVVVTGSSGTGKSSLVRHVAIKMQKEGYDVLPVLNPKDIIKWYNPCRKILYVVDDFCGTYTINPINFEKWKNLMEKIETLLEKKQVKLIMSCRLQVYKDKKMKSLTFQTICECNLLTEDMCLSKIEKQSIAELYLKTNASHISEFSDTFDCFPLLCQLYSKNTNLSCVNFFANPFTVYKEEIDKLETEGAHVKYCALALCVMFDNRLKEEWLTEDVEKDIKQIISNTYEACKVVKGTSRLVIRDELDSLTDTFIRKDGEVYRTIHDKLFDFFAFYFGSVMIYCLINNASSSFMRERFLFQKRSKSDEFIIIVPERYQEMFIKRMINDWSRGYVVDVFCNINMDNQIFRRRFLKHIKDMETSEQKQLADSYDINDKGSPLLQCCSIGDNDLVEWCLRNCISNVNHCSNDEGLSPILVACENGHNKVVQTLINNKAEVNTCNNRGSTPLSMACKNGHTEVVQKLINNKADIHQCRNNGASPLLVACECGHAEIVKLLINNKADIHQCNKKGSTPLLMASQNGHTEVVQLLINNKSDKHLCNEKGSFPLFMASQNGHTEVVQLLINNKADIHQCTKNGASPLLIACECGHAEVVKLLINNKADIHQCNKNGSSPLLKASDNGHTEVVQLLINNKADIHQCNEKGSTPLLMASQNGHTEVVQLLINNKSDKHLCNEKGSFPLFMASQNGHTEVVQLLINNKADIHQCTKNGASPLLIACECGHAEVVKLLINNKADIHQCNKNGSSPLLKASYNGHTEVVQLLINNKADIHQCNEKGSTPLLMASQNGHTEVVQLLIKNKSDKHLCNDNGSSPLFVTSQN